ncbi:hypothetical protein [Amycolatopsis sp. NPDC004378]
MHEETSKMGKGKIAGAMLLAATTLVLSAPEASAGGSVSAQGCSGTVTTWRSAAESGLTSFNVRTSVECGFGREAALRLGVDCDTGSSPRFSFRDGNGATTTSGTVGWPMVPTSHCSGRVMVGYWNPQAGDFVWGQPAYFEI